MRWVTAHRTPAVTAVAEAVMDAGTGWGGMITLALLAIGTVAAFRAYRPALAAAVALVVVTVATRLLKPAIARPRPAGALTLVDPGGYAMPSSHAAALAALAVAVLVALAPPASGRAAHRRATVVVAAVLVVVGVLMVYLGAHWPTDVLAGWALGGLVGWAAGRTVRALRPVRGAARR